MVRHEKNIKIAEISTFRMGGIARELVTLENDQDIVDFFEKIGDTKWFILGGGSNIIFPDGDSDITLVKLASGEIKIERDNENSLLTIPAGNNWDEVVEFAVSRGLSGIEALSAIPGTAGATPVQNVGAYGTEIKDVLVSLRAYDIKEKKFVTMANAECAFAYRDSIFKSKEKGRYLITSITIQLSHDEPNVPMYPGVDIYFRDHNIQRPKLLDIRNAITEIRWKKLPDPREVASVGSFFKNPFVSKQTAEDLHVKYPDLKMFPGEDGKIKIPAGWLIEKAGFKGRNFGNISVYEGNALVLVNNGGAKRAELESAITEIIETVNKLYGIRLETEPEILNF